MAREHGTRACYVAGCRRAECKGANAAAVQERKKLMAYGRWEPFVDAGPVREHLRALAGAGISYKRAAALAGLRFSTVSGILYGKPGRPPAARVRPATRDAILAVQATFDNLPDLGRVDGTGTMRRLQALMALGWPKTVLARRLGTDQLFGVHLAARPVTVAKARAVRALYDELWNTAPPARTARERTAALRARRFAERRGWLGPVAWDDDVIDDPAAGPVAEWLRPPGRRNRPGGDLAFDARELLGYGLGRAAAAGRLGVSVDALDKVLSRYPADGGEIASVA
jgi:hypothetical protein